MKPSLSMLEAQRLTLQRMLDAQKPLEERNRRGQFATPPELARDIIVFSLTYLPTNEPIRFLDPAIGTGAFYAALQASVPTGRIDQATGTEIDPHYAIPSRDLWSSRSLSLYQADFTTLQPPQHEEDRFNLIICNPPYVRHHHMDHSDKKRLAILTETIFGQRINGLAGLYCYFLALAQPWMQENAIAAWLVPSEFMTVNYGRVVKHYLLEKLTLLQVHRFDPNAVQFTDALVSSTILLLRNSPPHKDHAVTFSYGDTLSAPSVSKQVSVDDLRRESKWTRFPVADIREITTELTLNTFFQIKRGLVTGDNAFFILTPQQINTYNLPWQFFRPILPSPRYLDNDEIFADAQGLPITTKPLFLLDCRLPENHIQVTYPNLWAYLQTGIPEASQRYLCSKRTPWYSQEQRLAPPFLCAYMGRSTSKHGRPFRFILNHSRATAANVYLLLYPKPQLAQTLLLNPSLKRTVWEILNTIKLSNLLDESRVYGGGLYKLEPSELGNVNGAPLQSIVTALMPEQLALQP